MRKYAEIRRLKRRESNNLNRADHQSNNGQTSRSHHYSKQACKTFYRTASNNNKITRGSKQRGLGRGRASRWESDFSIGVMSRQGEPEQAYSVKRAIDLCEENATTSNDKRVSEPSKSYSEASTDMTVSLNVAVAVINEQRKENVR